MRTVEISQIRSQCLRPSIDIEFTGEEDVELYFFVHFKDFMEDSDPCADIHEKAIEFFENQEGEWYVLNNQSTRYNVYNLSEVNQCAKTKFFLNKLLKRTYSDLDEVFKPYRESLEKMLNKK